MEQKHSGLGITSFVISLLVGVLTFAAIIIAGFMSSRHPDGMDEKAASTIILGLAIIGFMLLDLLALALGIAGLFQKDTKKVFAVLGIIFSLLTLLGTIGLIIIGTALS